MLSGETSAKPHRPGHETDICEQGSPASVRYLGLSAAMCSRAPVQWKARLFLTATRYIYTNAAGGLSVQNRDVLRTCVHRGLYSQPSSERAGRRRQTWVLVQRTRPAALALARCI